MEGLASSPTKPVTMTLSTDAIRYLEDLVENGVYKNRSQATQAAIDLLYHIDQAGMPLQPEVLPGIWALLRSIPHLQHLLNQDGPARQS